jgi:hypothetical protein
VKGYDGGEESQSIIEESIIEESHYGLGFQLIDILITMDII